jgi:hypothetical protein
MNTNVNLVPVRDVYDTMHYVEAEALADQRRMLKTYHRNGRPRMVRDLGRNAADWHPSILCRDNICPHPRQTWIAKKFPDGKPADYCPVCCVLDAAADGRLSDLRDAMDHRDNLAAEGGAV